jgi:hypothetical protein
MDADYKGYNNSDDNKKMALKSLKNLIYFDSYCIQKSFNFNKQNNKQNIYNF